MYEPAQKTHIYSWLYCNWSLISYYRGMIQHRKKKGSYSELATQHYMLLRLHWGGQISGLQLFRWQPAYNDVSFGVINSIFPLWLSLTLLMLHCIIITGSQGEMVSRMPLRYRAVMKISPPCTNIHLTCIALTKTDITHKCLITHGCTL